MVQSTSRSINPRISQNIIAANKHSHYLKSESARQLIVIAQTGNREALDILMNAHEWLVMNIAGKFQFDNPQAEFDDLAQAGRIGLWKAILAYQSNSPASLVTFAVPKIKGYIADSLGETSNTTRLPHHMYIFKKKVFRFVERFEQENERKPLVEEIAEEMNVSSEKVYLALHGNVNSVDFSNEENDVYLMPEEDVFYKEDMQVHIQEVLGVLTSREQSIVKKYFGIGCNEEMRLADIAEQEGCTYERARQILRKAIETMQQYDAVA